MTASDVDPVLLVLALLGALGFVGMALCWAITGAGRHNDGVTWAAEREAFEAGIAELVADAREAYAAGWNDAWNTAAADADRAALNDHLALAAREGLATDPPPEWN